MEQLNTLSDAALLDRIERLERAEHDLQKSAMGRASNAAFEEVFPHSDPQYHFLSCLLTKVRDDLLKMENEFLRRGTLRIERVA